MSDIRKYIDLVEGAQSQVSESTELKSKLTRQDYFSAARFFEDATELDNGQSRTRFGIHHYNPQKHNLETVARYLNQIEPGHFYKLSELNNDSDATKCFNNIYNVDRKPVMDVVYSRFSGYPVGAYSHSYTSAEEAEGRKAEQAQERENDQARKRSKGEY